MVEYGPETILIAVIVSSVAFIIIAVILILMFIYIRRLGNQQSVDNSLQNECKKAEEKKDKVIETLNREKQILMSENVRIMDMNEELAILLSQEKQ